MRTLVQFYIRHARQILVAALVLTVFCGWFASGLELNADLERLLPDDAPSVQGLRKLDAEYGIIGRVSVVMSGAESEDLRQHLVELNEQLLEIETIDRGEVKRPTDFFKTHRLLYLSKEDLEIVHGRISKRIKWEKQRANPLFIDIGSKKKPTLDMSDVEARYTDVKTAEDPYFCDESACVLFVYPSFSAGDLVRSRDMLETVRETVDAYCEPAGLKCGISGRYQKRIDQQDALTRDLALGTTIALVLLLLFLLVYFNGITTSLITLIPLIMGTIWSFAYARLAFGNLNILTGFFGAVLLGLGIDYGIHIVSRYLEARQTSEVEDALVETLKSAGRASIFAGLTTVVAFGSLTTSSFLAFNEYGSIALGGMSLVVLANVVILPCLLIAVAGTRFDPKPTLSVRLAGYAHTMVEFLAKHRNLFTAGFVAALIAAAFGLPNVAFEYDFRQIQTTDLDSWHLDEKVDEILGISQIPVVFLLKDEADADLVKKIVEERKDSMDEGWTIDRVVTRSDVVPADQDEKFDLVRDLERQFAKLPQSVIKDDVKTFREEIGTLSSAKEITFETLPETVRAPLARRKGVDGTVALVFPTIAQHDAKEMMDLAAIIRGIPKEDGTTLEGITDALLLVDILDSVERDSLYMLGYTVIGLFIVALIAFRRPRKVLLLVGTITVASLTATGWVGLLDIKFNFINMLTIPIWLGLGVDAAFHLMVRAEDAPGDYDGFVATAFAVMAAFATSMIGFGAMLVTSHGGLFSMGALACVGLAAILWVSMYIQWIVFAGGDE